MSHLRSLLVTAALVAASTSLSSSAQAQCVPAMFPANWLQLQEIAGGHTIARHVGQTDLQLTNRLAAQPHIQAAGSYPANPAPPIYAAAQATITAGLAANAVAINNWANGAPNGATQAYNYTAVATIGRVATRHAPPPPAAVVANTCTYRVVLRSLGGGACFLLTSFPTPATPADHCP